MFFSIVYILLDASLIDLHRFYLSYTVVVLTLLCQYVYIHVFEHTLLCQYVYIHVFEHTLLCQYEYIHVFGHIVMSIRIHTCL